MPSRMTVASCPPLRGSRRPETMSIATRWFSSGGRPSRPLFGEARCVEIGAWRRDGREICLDRATLSDRIWSEPIERVAKEWALSGRGLAKACGRLKIISAGWSVLGKAQHGSGSTDRVSRVPPGEAEEIVIRTPRRLWPWLTPERRSKNGPPPADFVNRRLSTTGLSTAARVSTG